MRLLLIAVLLASAQSTLFGEGAFYGSIAVAAYSSAKSTTDISLRFATGVLKSLQQQSKVKAVGEAHVLTSDPTTELITKRFSESKVDTLAVIRIESGSEESATYSIEVVQHAEGAELVRAIAMVGRVVIRQDRCSVGWHCEYVGIVRIPIQRGPCFLACTDHSSSK